MTCHGSSSVTQARPESCPTPPQPKGGQDSQDPRPRPSARRRLPRPAPASVERPRPALAAVEGGQDLPRVPAARPSKAAEVRACGRRGRPKIAPAAVEGGTGPRHWPSRAADAISPKRAELAGLNGVSPQCGTGSIFSPGGHHFERDEESRALVTLL